MRNFLIILFNLTMMIKAGFAQQSRNQYFRTLAEAQSYYKSKEYVKSAQKYTDLYHCCEANMTANDYYDAACSYALGNLPDSAMLYLSLAVNDKKYNNISHIQSDEDLNGLHVHENWNAIIERVKFNKREAEKGYNRPVVSLLDSIYNFDQGGRKEADDIEKKYGYKSPEMKNYLRGLNIRDSLNIIKVTSVIDKYGWLGPDKIGEQGNTTLFLVIQHADKEVHEKYLPIMRKAVLNGNAKSAHLALLEDRTALEEGKKQIYGSQVIRDPKSGKPAFAPIEDERNVDARREAVGLGPLEEYAKMFHIDYHYPGDEPGK